MSKNTCDLENNHTNHIGINSINSSNNINSSYNDTEHTHVLDISGLDCPSCAKELENDLKSNKFIADAHIDFLNNKIKVKCHNASNCINTIRKIISNHGYEIREVSSDSFLNFQSKFTIKNYIYTFEFYVILLASIFLLSYLYTKYSSFAISSIIICSLTVIKKAYIELKRLKLGMNILMLSASYGSIFINEYLEGTMILFLFSISKWLENIISEKAKASIDVLKKNLPAIAHKIYDDNNTEDQVHVSTLKPNDKILIKPYEVIPIDGIVDDGTSQVDESSITGESNPSDKRKGDKVYAGTTNQDGSLKVIVTHFPNETKFSRILEAVEIAKSQKTKLQTSIETFAEKYTPIVFIIAALVTIIPILLGNHNYTNYIYKSLTILVISCPCALVLAVPVALVCAIINAAKKGVLVKSGEVIENTSKVKAIAFDKTGTITKGEPVITKIENFTNNLSNTEIIKIISALELHSEHKLAKAFEKLAEEKNIYKYEIPNVENFRAIKGYGIEGTIDGIMYRFGKVKWATEIIRDIYNQNTNKSMQNLISYIQNNQSKQSISALCSEKEILAIVYFDDTLRDDAINTINELYNLGIRNTILISGDRSESVMAIARESNINESVGNLDPEEKKDYINKIIAKYGPTIMVGDGINDTPALAAANVGIAMGCRGVDAALATADAVIIYDKLSPIPQLVSISRYTNKIIQQNIYFSVFLKLTIFTLSMFGYTSLWMAVLADTGASLIVVLNSLRVLKY